MSRRSYYGQPGGTRTPFGSTGKKPKPQPLPAPEPEQMQLPPLPYDEANAVGRLRHRVMLEHRGRSPWATAAGDVKEWINSCLYPCKSLPW